MSDKIQLFDRIRLNKAGEWKIEVTAPDGDIKHMMKVSFEEMDKIIRYASEVRKL